MNRKPLAPYCAAGDLWLMNQCDATRTDWGEIRGRFLKIKQQNKTPNQQMTSNESTCANAV
ncbi:rCG53436 [Rattus norvegicus]|uniref:RCG53436 n=1 Tax=Rattus norvegicus TaxID=10116 RepID=A6JRR7_RAT|nr:rCG53436 [Rattus norvegicus]